MLAAEHTAAGNRGFAGSLVQAGAPIGVIAAMLAVAMVSGWLGNRGLIEWGWRLPFFASLCSSSSDCSCACASKRAPSLPRRKAQDDPGVPPRRRAEARSWAHSLRDCDPYRRRDDRHGPRRLRAWLRDARLALLADDLPDRSDLGQRRQPHRCAARRALDRPRRCLHRITDRLCADGPVVISDFQPDPSLRDRGRLLRHHRWPDHHQHHLQPTGSLFSRIVRPGDPVHCLIHRLSGGNDLGCSESTHRATVAERRTRRDVAHLALLCGDRARGWSLRAGRAGETPHRPDTASGLRTDCRAHRRGRPGHHRCRDGAAHFIPNGGFSGATAIRTHSPKTANNPCARATLPHTNFA